MRSRRRLSRRATIALYATAGVVGVVLFSARSGPAAPTPSQDRVPVAAGTVPSASAGASAGGAPSPTAVSSQVDPAAAKTLLRQAANGDGDSWKDTRGVEYRMGLINTPELDECGGPLARAYRRSRLSDGFRAESYQVDRYGRAVSVVFTAGGVNLNVDMARQGIADDRYLTQFRSENPGLARELDGAFAEAKAAKRGIWGSCGSTT